MATEFSSFEAPTLPAPDSATPAPLPPPGSDMPTAPASPLSLPDLPPPTTTPTTTTTTTTDAVSTHVDAPTAISKAPAPSRKRSFPTGLVVALFAVAVVGIAGFLVLTGSSDDAIDPAAEAPTDETAAEPSTAIGQTLADTNEVVDQINANEQEVALLEELGLDADGNAQPAVDETADAAETGLIVPDALAGYRFTWADPSGQDLDVTIDTTTGDFSVVASDGISFRRIGDAFYGQEGLGGEWYQLATDPFGDVPVIGIDGLPPVSTILPSAVEAHIASDTRDGAVRIVMIDDAAFAAVDLSARNDWLAPWGLLNEDGERASSAIVRVTFDSTGEHVVGAHIETPAIGGFASFTVTETFDTAPAIANPLAD